MPATHAQNRTPVGLKQIRDDGCLTYLLWDRATRDALVVDPSFGALGELREALQENSLKLVAIIETHTHADHPSSSHSLRQETGAKVVMGRGTTSARADWLVSTGDAIAFGTQVLKVLETPGHTPDSICLLHFGEGDRTVFAFTGDTVMIGSTGRTDFPSADPAALFRSLRLLEDQLLPQTRIFPAHDYSELIFSLWGVEKSHNPQVAERHESSFVALKREESLAVMTSEVLQLIEFNLSADPGEIPRTGTASGVAACGSALPNIERVPAISVQKYAPKLDSRARGELYIDVRESAEFTAGHISGTENIPLSELALHWDRLAGAKKIYLSCQSGRRSQMAARTLDRLGLTGVVNVSGGYQAWSNAGLPVEK
jgi:glyoxylase-like metal-dependent hydrolase (beta-lactamase superfamily II)/rhodanese-related sulfurtransferase